MFNVGPLELLVILVIALLVVGPEELPKVLKKVGAFIGELRRHGEDVRAQVRDLIDDAVSEEDMKSTVESIEKVRSSLSLGSLASSDPGDASRRSSTGAKAGTGAREPESTSEPENVARLDDRIKKQDSEGAPARSSDTEVQDRESGEAK